MSSEPTTYQSVETQRDLWPKSVDFSTNPAKLYSYGWGDPYTHEAVNAAGDILGNYWKILKGLLLPNVSGKRALDLGCFDGKWTYFMEQAASIICVDLDDTGFRAMQKRLVNYPPMMFYKTAGDELAGIPDQSVDFIFSIDSLVRSEVPIIEKYIAEFARIISPDGKICVHLPEQSQPLSHKLGFTQIDSEMITNFCIASGLADFRIERNIINHGILLLKGL